MESNNKIGFAEALGILLIVPTTGKLTLVGIIPL